MKALEKLDLHLRTRLSQLYEAKERGRKIVGYGAGGYLPEELILACGAIPVGFVQAGDGSALKDAVPYVCRWYDPFWRSQIGYVTSGRDPYYNVADLIVTAMTDQHCRTFTSVVDYYLHDRPSFMFGVPHHTKDEAALAYYHYGLTRLKKRLEELTGVDITDSRLEGSIALCNRERELFREISRMRESKDSAIAGRDVVALHHGSFLADKEFMVSVLEAFVKEAKAAPPAAKKGPRVLFTGSTLADGDSKVMDLIEASGGVVVREEFDEGMRPWSKGVSSGGDLMADLAQSYYVDRICAGWFRPVNERLEFLVRLAGEYEVEAVVWYQLMLRESYKIQSFFFPEMLKKETGVSMLVVESDYSATETGPMRTRIETFFESIKEASRG